MAMVAAVVLVGLLTISTLGAYRLMSVTRVIRCRSMVAASKADTAIGISCTDCSRFWAVTMTSSSDSFSDWANAWLPTAASTAPANRVFAGVFFMRLSPSVFFECFQAVEAP